LSGPSNIARLVKSQAVCKMPSVVIARRFNIKSHPSQLQLQLLSSGRSSTSGCHPEGARCDQKPR
jgi:hypothetical protein